MTGEEKKNKKYTKKTILFIVPTTIMIFLLIQNISIKNKLSDLEVGIYSYQQDINFMKDELASISQQTMIAADVETDSIVLSELLKEADKDNEDIEDIVDIEDIEELESRVIWNSESQTALAWDSNSGIRRVYLTFDDGPSSNTDKILDILNEYGVKATFFVVGKEGYNSQYQRIVEEGHTLGMHSFSHKYGEIYKSVESYKKDLYKLHDFLYEVTGVDTNVVRFPGGSSNTVSRVDMQELIEFLNQEGLDYFDWNISSGDASSSYVSAETITSNVLKYVKKYDTVVILFHDASSKGTTVQALPDIIESILASDNTVLLPITQETTPVQHITEECQQ